MGTLESFPEPADEEPIEEFLFEDNIEFNIAPDPSALYELLKNNITNDKSIYATHVKAKSKEFDPEKAFEKSPITLKIFNRLMRLGAEYIEELDTDAHGKQIAVNGEVSKAMVQTYKETCFGMLDLFYSADSPDGAIEALNSMDVEIVEDTIDTAFNRAKKLAWDKEPRAKDNASVDKYPLLKRNRLSLEQFSTNKARTSGFAPNMLKKNVETPYYHGGMAVLLTLAWYAEQTNPNIQPDKSLSGDMNRIVMSEVEIEDFARRVQQDIDSL